MKLIMDSCTIILLAKSGVLEDELNHNDVFITKQVYDEVLKGKSKMFQDAFLLERLYKEKKVKLISVEEKITKKLMKDFNMGIGEASTIAVGITNNDFLLATDNRQGRKASSVYNLPLVGTISLIVSLYKNKKINLEKAKFALKKLREVGWFETYLIEKTTEDLK